MLGFAPLGRLAFGQLPELINPVVLGEAGAFSLTGNDVTFDRSAPAAVGTFTITGQPTLRLFGMPAAVGAFTFSGQAANLEHGYRLVASPTVVDTQEQPLFQALGVLAIGQSGSEIAQATTFVLTGVNTTGERGVGVAASAGIFTLTGISATLTFGQGYPTNIRIFPRVGRGIRTFSGGRPLESTGPLTWDGFILTWDGERLLWNGQDSRGGIIARTSAGRGIRARAFGG